MSNLLSELVLFVLFYTSLGLKRKTFLSPLFYFLYGLLWSYVDFHTSKKEIKEFGTTFLFSELSLVFKLSVLPQNPILNN